jgi:hypothetical protein
MPKGYAEGPAAEEAERRAEELERAAGSRPKAYEHELEWPAVFGCTDDDPEPHFLGWVGDVDPDALFASGEAWGLKVVRTRVADV